MDGCNLEAAGKLKVDSVGKKADQNNHLKAFHTEDATLRVKDTEEQAQVILLNEHQADKKPVSGSKLDEGQTRKLQLGSRLRVW